MNIHKQLEVIHDKREPHFKFNTSQYDTMIIYTAEQSDAAAKFTLNL